MVFRNSAALMAISTPSAKRLPPDMLVAFWTVVHEMSTLGVATAEWKPMAPPRDPDRLSRISTSTIRILALTEFTCGSEWNANTWADSTHTRRRSADRTGRNHSRRMGVQPERGDMM